MSTPTPTPDANEFIRYLKEAGATIQKGSGRMLDENGEEISVEELFQFPGEIVNTFDELLSLFPEEYLTPGNKNRMKMLYQMALETVSANDRLAVLSEILSYESEEGRQHLSSESYYEAPAPEKLLNAYSAYALYAARLRYNSGSPSALASYLLPVFDAIINDKRLCPPSLKAENRRVISEAFLDFLYASGKSSNMSFRLHDYIM